MPRATDNLYQITRFLLTQEPATVAAISQTTGIPLPSATQTIRWLRYHRAVRSRNRRLVADPVRLLDIVASTRRAEVVPARTVSTSLDEAAASEALGRAGIAHALVYLSAANRHLYYQPERRVMIAVGRGSATAARRRLPNGPTAVEIFERDLPRAHTVHDADGLPITDLYETAIDIRAHPDGGPHATLLEQAITRRPRRAASNG